MSAVLQQALKRAHVAYVATEAVEGVQSSQAERYRALERTVRPAVPWPGKEVAADATQSAKSSRIRPEHWLLVVSAWEYLSLQISTQASNQVWLDFYAGDYGAQARAMGRLAAAGGLLGFLLKPMLAQASDVFGRKPLLLISYVIQAVVKSGIALAPTSISVPLLAVSQYLLGFVTWELSTQTIDSAIGDVLSTNMERLTAVVANQQTMWQVVTIAGPVLGSYLARVGGTRLPLAITGASFALITATIATQVPETLPQSDREEKFVFSFGQSSPLGVLRLFRNGPGLLIATILQTVDFWSDESSLWDVQIVHQVGVTGWDTGRRGYFDSVTSLLNLPSYALAGWLNKKVGVMKALQLGNLANTIFYAAMGTARTDAWYTLSMFGSCTYSAQTAMSMVEAKAAGLGQGELQAGMSTLNSISHMLAPVVLSSLYDLGIKLGTDGLFYYVIAGSHTAKFLLVAAYSLSGSAKAEQLAQAAAEEE